MSDTLEPFSLPPGIRPADAIEVITELFAAKIRKLEARLVEVENKGVRYRGIFQRADLDSYKRGDAVTAQGALWIALKDGPADVPGNSPDWQLAVQKGRDGRDALRVA